MDRGDADVDNLIQATYSDPNDIEAEVVSSRVKSIAHVFSDSFFNGDAGLNPKTFGGLTKVLTGTREGEQDDINWVQAVAAGGEVVIDVDLWQSIGIAALAGGVIALIAFLQNVLEDRTGSAGVLVRKS